MAHETHFPILKELGLSETEALIYELLLESGTSEARILVDSSGMGRGNVYNVLMQLQAKGLVLMIEGKKQQFQAVDPSKLRGLLEAKQLSVSRLEAEFAAALPQLASAFSLSTGKPTVQTFEGIDGFRTALADMLTSKTEICTYIDVAALKGPLAELDDWFSRARIKHGIAQKVLVSDTSDNREALSTPIEHSETRFIRGFPTGQQTAVELYDGTVAYFTLGDKNIAVLIKDPAIFATQKRQFDFLWNQAASAMAPSTGSGSNTK